MSNNNIHDCGYKNFFQNPVAVKQLLTSFVNEAWIRQLDFKRITAKTQREKQRR